MKEFLIFAAFYAVILGAQFMHARYERRKMDKLDHVKSHINAKIVGVVGVVAQHEPLWHAMKDYVVHVVVYSGAVIPAH